MESNDFLDIGMPFVEKPKIEQSMVDTEYSDDVIVTNSQLIEDGNEKETTIIFEDDGKKVDEKIIESSDEDTVKAAEALRFMKKFHVKYNDYVKRSIKEYARSREAFLYTNDLYELNEKNETELMKSRGYEHYEEHKYDEDPQRSLEQQIVKTYYDNLQTVTKNIIDTRIKSIESYISTLEKNKQLFKNPMFHALFDKEILIGKKEIDLLNRQFGSKGE